jgi:hypothetical protein
MQKFFVSQFYDIAEVAIIHKQNLAIKKYERNK